MGEFVSCCSVVYNMETIWTLLLPHMLYRSIPLKLLQISQAISEVVLTCEMSLQNSFATVLTVTRTNLSILSYPQVYLTLSFR